MFNFFRELLNDGNTSEKLFDEEIKNRYDSEKIIQLATCALFIEVAKSDDKFSDKEKEKIISLMEEMFSLNQKEVTELINLANHKVEESVSLYEFTDVLNSYFDNNQKYEVIKNIWRIILADKEINKYEEYFVRTINNNFHLEHSDMIAAKMEVKKEIGIE